MQPTTADAYKLFHDASLVFAKIEANGIRIHTKRLDRTIQQTEEHIRTIEGELKQTDVWGIWTKAFPHANIDSNPQLANVLYEKMGFECKAFTEKGRPSVSEKSLQDVDHPFVRKLFEARHLKKTVGTFLKGIKKEVVDGFLHPFINAHTTVSGRSSSDSPNFQNLPNRDKEMARLVRRCVIPRSKTRRIAEIDFKGAEVCVASVVSGDKNLQAYVRDKTKDMHRDTAMKLFKLNADQTSKPIRNSSKSWFVFAEFYGDYYVHCAKNLWEAVDRDRLALVDGTPLRKHLRKVGLKDMGDCEDGRDTRPGTFEAHVRDVEKYLWGEMFPGYANWKKEMWQEYQQRGYYDTVTGFRCTFGTQGLLKKNEANNLPIQGPSAHCLFWYLIQLQAWLEKEKMKTCIIAQIHDSGVLDAEDGEIKDVVQKSKAIITEDLPKHFKWLKVPMSVEIEVAGCGESWYEKKPYE